MSTTTRRPPKRGAQRRPAPKGGARRAPSGRSATQRPPVMTIVIGVIVVAGIAAVALSRGGSGGIAGIEQIRDVTITGSALTEAPSSGADPAIGATIPEVEGTDFAGTPVAIRRDGTPKLIMFMAHWCSHCQAEAPVIVDWLEKSGRPEGVDLLSVSTGTDPNKPNYPPSTWLEREGWDVPVIVDNRGGAAARAYGLSGFPFFVAVDGDGRVVARASGELDVDTLEKLVAAARG